MDAKISQGIEIKSHFFKYVTSKVHCTMHHDNKTESLERLLINKLFTFVQSFVKVSQVQEV